MCRQLFVFDGHTEISLWHLFVSSFKWLPTYIHFPRMYSLLFVWYSFLSHVIYMANPTAKLLLKNAKWKCCHIFYIEYQRKIFYDECTFIRCAIGNLTHTAESQCRFSICASAPHHQFISILVCDSIGGAFLSLAASFCDGIIHPLLTLNDE